MRRPFEVKVSRVSPPGENVGYICGSESERSVRLQNVRRPGSELEGSGVDGSLRG